MEETKDLQNKVKEIIKDPLKYENVVKQRASEILVGILLSFDENKIKQLTPKTVASILPVLMELVYSFKAPDIENKNIPLTEKMSKLKKMLNMLSKEYPEVAEMVKNVKET